MKKMILILAGFMILGGCTPKYTMLVREDEESMTKLRELRKTTIPTLYQLSPTGKIVSSEGYIYWDEKGMTIFVKR